MSETITMNKEMLTEVVAQAMAQAMALSAQRTMALPSRADGEQSNIINHTEFYNLPLPTGNEVVAYQDFINDANNIIDAALHSIQNTLDTVSTTATNAADGVAAADTKIQELVQANIDNETASLPKYKQDTDIRLENLEDDVNGLSSWTGGWLDAAAGVDSNSIKTSSIGVYFAGISESNYVDFTEVVKNYFSRSVINTRNFHKHDVAKKSGNIFNLPEINVYYVLPSQVVGIIPDSNIVVGTAYVGIKWTGTETVFTVLDGFATGIVRRWPITFLPIVPYTN